MRTTASILHLDLDAFFASVEQRDKPSLRGKPVIVGGVGPRGVVSTASYEARAFGVRSAMSTAQARTRCPHGAFLNGRFDAYREASRLVMDTAREVIDVVEQVSVDEAFGDLASLELTTVGQLESFATSLATRIGERTGGLTCSIGIASSRFMAKIASELNKPAGVFVVAPGTETALLGPMEVSAIPGVGPATAERLGRIGITTIEQLREHTTAELASVIGRSSAASLSQFALGIDHRSVGGSRESKSISVEETFAEDIADRQKLEEACRHMADKVTGRLRQQGFAAKTITIKVRHGDFETHTRSQTLPGPTDSRSTITETALSLLAGTELRSGLRLLGVGLSQFTDWVQNDLFSAEDESGETESIAAPAWTQVTASWRTGQDIHHTDHGDGWVWGAGLGKVTVRFETRHTGPGPVRTFAEDDPALLSGHRDTVVT